MPADPLAIPEFSSLAQLKNAPKEGRRRSRRQAERERATLHASTLPDAPAASSAPVVSAPPDAPPASPDPVEPPTPAKPPVEPELPPDLEPAPLAPELPVETSEAATEHLADDAPAAATSVVDAPAPPAPPQPETPVESAPAADGPARLVMAALRSAPARAETVAAPSVAPEIAPNVAPESAPEASIERVEDALPEVAEQEDSALPQIEASPEDETPPLPVLEVGEEIVFPDEEIAAAGVGVGGALARVGLLAGAAAVFLLAAQMQGSTAPAAPLRSGSTVALAPTPTVPSLAVVNPQNAAVVAALATATAAAEFPAQAEAASSIQEAAPSEAAGADASPTSALAGSARGTLSALFPFAIEIVTPTPRAGEEMLFSDPMVASEEGSAAAPAPSSSVEQPVILPAIGADAGGNAVPAASLEELARPRILPAVAVALIPDRATPTPTAQPLPTAAPIVLEPGRAWSTFTPAADATHFWVGRPHPSFVGNQIAAPSYQFGSTGGGRYRPHHGMDIANTFGTPVRAATTGEVVHAGLDDPDVLGPYPNFYGNAVVIRLDRRLAVAGGEMDVYLLYGHLSEVSVQKGQRVQPDDIVGQVGMTGIAIGPHLHVEMRIGANTYEASVNPYLWVEPPPGHGAVAVRLLTADGRAWPRARVTLARFEGNLATWARVLEIYPDNESINPDPAFGESSAMEAVPEGVYYLVAVVNGERVAAEATVRAGETTFVEMRTQQ